jgi:hypothetical protein
MGRMAVVAAAVVAIACGGTAIDQTQSVHAAESGGSAGFTADTGGADPGGAGTSGSGGAAGAIGAGGRNALGTGGAVGGTGGASSFKVTFDFSVAGSQSFCRHDCVPPRVIISDSAGHELDLGGFCRTDCTTCLPTICPPIPCLPDEAVTEIIRDWDGIHYTQSSCGDARCFAPTVATAGTYVATTCLTPGFMSFPDGGSPRCNVTGSEVCGSIQFKVPSNETFSGTIGM